MSTTNEPGQHGSLWSLDEHSRWAAYNAPRWQRVRSRSARRALIGVQAVAVLAVLLISLVPRSLLTALVWTVATVGFFGVLMLLQGPATRGLFALNRTLDERQRALRDRAYRHAYLVGLPLMAVLLLAVLIAASVERLPTDPRAWTGILIATLWTAVALPVAVIAWTDPSERSEIAHPTA
jgi:hypothetical protein